MDLGDDPRIPADQSGLLQLLREHCAASALPLGEPALPVHALGGGNGGATALRRALRPRLAGVGVLTAACAPPWVGVVGTRGGGELYLYRLCPPRRGPGPTPYDPFFAHWAP